MIKVKQKDIVVPGDILVEGMDYVPGQGTYRLNDKIYASLLGLVDINKNVIKMIPLSGRYEPKRDDIIIGKVIDIAMSGWRIDTNSAYSAMLPMKDATSAYIRKGDDLTKYFDIGEYVVARITNVTSQKLIDLTMKGPGLKKLKSGIIIEINPHKIPRVIGKQGSMVSMIKQHTNCQIIVGQNGLIWISGKPEDEILTAKIIKFIEQESHISGLTEKVKSMLDKLKSKSGKEV